MGFITGSATDVICTAVASVMAFAFFGVGIFIYGTPAVIPQWWLMNGWWAASLSLAFLALLLAVLLIFIFSNYAFIRGYVVPIMYGGEIREFEVDHRMWSVVYIFIAFIVNCFISVGWITWNTYHDSFTINDLESIQGSFAYETYNNLLVISCVLCLYGGMKFVDLAFLNMTANQNLRCTRSIYDGFCSACCEEDGSQMSFKDFCNSNIKKIVVKSSVKKVPFNNKSGYEVYSEDTF